jgi:hypothetical protein
MFHPVGLCPALVRDLMALVRAQPGVIALDVLTLTVAAA